MFSVLLKKKGYVIRNTLSKFHSLPEYILNILYGHRDRIENSERLAIETHYAKGRVTLDYYHTLEESGQNSRIIFCKVLL